MGRGEGNRSFEVEPVECLPVDDATGAVAGEDGGDFECQAPAALAGRPIAGRGHMWGNHDVGHRPQRAIGRERFLFGHVPARQPAAGLPGAPRPAPASSTTRPRAVLMKMAWGLHQRELGSADQVIGVRQEGVRGRR